jgi:hypothetical protein
MEIRTVRRPGEKGTRKLVEKYGERLICIRYRYDPARKKRLKTVELIVSEEDWQPPEPHPQELEPTGFGPEKFYVQRVGVRLAYNEVDLRRQVKAVGGMWDPAERLWFLPEEHVRRLGLLQRVVKR